MRFVWGVALSLIPGLALAVCITDKYSSVICADAPVHYYRLNDPSGTTITDLGSSAVNGTYKGGFTLNSTTLLSGSGGVSTTFNGTTGWGDLGASANPTFGPDTTNAAGWSWEGWLNETDAVGGSMSSRSNTANGANQWALFTNTPAGKNEICLDSCSALCDFGAVASAASTWVQNTTVYIGVTTTGSGSNHLGRAEIYINGLLSGSATSFTGSLCQPANAQAQMATDSRAGSNLIDPIAGRLGEIAYYGNVLTANQFLRHYLAGKGRFPQWPLTVKLEPRLFDFSTPRKLNSWVRPGQEPLASNSQYTQ